MYNWHWCYDCIQYPFKAIVWLWMYVFKDSFVFFVLTLLGKLLFTTRSHAYYHIRFFLKMLFCSVLAAWEWRGVLKRSVLILILVKVILASQRVKYNSQNFPCSHDFIVWTWKLALISSVKSWTFYEVRKLSFGRSFSYLCLEKHFLLGVVNVSPPATSVLLLLAAGLNVE